MISSHTVGNKIPKMESPSILVTSVQGSIYIIKRNSYSCLICCIGKKKNEEYQVLVLWEKIFQKWVLWHAMCLLQWCLCMFGFRMWSQTQPSIVEMSTWHGDWLWNKCFDVAAMFVHVWLWNVMPNTTKHHYNEHMTSQTQPSIFVMMLVHVWFGLACEAKHNQASLQWACDISKHLLGAFFDISFPKINRVFPGYPRDSQGSSGKLRDPQGSLGLFWRYPESSQVCPRML